MTFLPEVERNYLSVDKTHQFSNGYSRTIKSRLQKKIERFASEELPLLIEKGCLDVTEFPNVTENSNALVAQRGRALAWDSNNEKKEKKPRRGFDP